MFERVVTDEPPFEALRCEELEFEEVEFQEFEFKETELEELEFEEIEFQEFEFEEFEAQEFEFEEFEFQEFEFEEFDVEERDLDDDRELNKLAKLERQPAVCTLPSAWMRLIFGSALNASRCATVSCAPTALITPSSWVISPPT